MGWASQSPAGSVGWAEVELSLGEVGVGLTFSWGGGCSVWQGPSRHEWGPEGLENPLEKGSWRGERVMGMGTGFCQKGPCDRVGGAERLVPGET